MGNKFELFEYINSPKLHYAARCKPLGLTAYGYTIHEACNNLKSMFDKWVDLQDKYPKLK
jgi:hypothetical protein